jgi:two-component system cell cycle sensor histidine kinase/response regulator CckA
LADDLGMVKVDPGQMEQVIVNLSVNAKDAMPQGGKLTIETTNVELDEGYTQNHMGVVPGAYVLLSINDTGVGMSKEIKEQIFDPFFTTKEKGKGTGLGLSTVYGIVKQSGGDIFVYTEVGHGTTFKIYFPRVFEPGEELAKKEAGEGVPRGTETILVVEDDGMVRKLAIDILRTQGYTVLEAGAGGEALLVCEQYKEPIHLILTDVVMPNMSGAQFIERLKQVRKDFKVVYMTGYAENAITHHGLLEEGVNLIHKPFRIEKLARKVREVLDGS